jgi:hypothetical protein
MQSATKDRNPLEGPSNLYDATDPKTRTILSIPLATAWTVHIPIAWASRERAASYGQRIKPHESLFSVPVTLVAPETQWPHPLQSPRWGITMPFTSPLCAFLQKTFPGSHPFGTQQTPGTPFWSDWQCNDGTIRLLQCRVLTCLMCEPVTFVFSFDGVLTLTD